MIWDSSPLNDLYFLKTFVIQFSDSKSLKKKRKTFFFSFVVILPTPSLHFCYFLGFFFVFFFFYFLKKGRKSEECDVMCAAGRENEKRTHAEITNDDVTHLTRLDIENIFRVSIILYIGYYIMMCVCVCLCVCMAFFRAACVREGREEREGNKNKKEDGVDRACHWPAHLKQPKV